MEFVELYNTSNDKTLFEVLKDKNFYDDFPITCIMMGYHISFDRSILRNTLYLISQMKNYTINEIGFLRFMVDNDIFREEELIKLIPNMPSSYEDIKKE